MQQSDIGSGLLSRWSGVQIPAGPPHTERAPKVYISSPRSLYNRINEWIRTSMLITSLHLKALLKAGMKIYICCF